MVLKTGKYNTLFAEYVNGVKYYCVGYLDPKAGGPVGAFVDYKIAVDTFEKVEKEMAEEGSNNCYNTRKSE